MAFRERDTYRRLADPEINPVRESEACRICISGVATFQSRYDDKHSNYHCINCGSIFVMASPDPEYFDRARVAHLLSKDSLHSFSLSENCSDNLISDHT